MIVARNVTGYNLRMIKSFKHKGLQIYFEIGSKAGIQPHHADKLSKQLGVLHHAKKPDDMGVPNWKLHALNGELADHWAVSVNGNWRLIFKFEDGDAVLVDYRDYH
jgi:proteic killer suppression protein